MHNCSCCGEPTDDDFRYCTTCRAAAAENAREFRTGRKAEGLCVCGAPLPEGYSNCDDCRKKIADRVTELYAARRKQGLCRCGAATLPGLATCRECLRRRQLHRKQNVYCKLCDVVGHGRLSHRRMGLCTQCSKPHAPDARLCEDHLALKLKKDYGHERHVDRKAKGLCIRCGVRSICAARSKSRCEECLDYASREQLQRRSGGLAERPHCQGPGCTKPVRVKFCSRTCRDAFERQSPKAPPPPKRTCVQCGAPARVRFCKAECRQEYIREHRAPYCSLCRKLGHRRVHCLSALALLFPSLRVADSRCCGLCGQPGHRRTECPNLHSTATLTRTG